MAGKKAAPKPAEPTLANKHRHQKRIEYEPVTGMSSRKTEKDVVQLINCLAEWTRDLQAARSAAPGAPPQRSGSRSHARGAVSTVSPTPSYPRGNPLTQSMEFTDRDGTGWLAYIESAPLPPSRQPTSGTVLPERHLRFDSATESRFTSLLPAGSPFVGEARLQSLLDEARRDLPLAATTGSPARARSGLGHRVIAGSARIVASGREGIADWARLWRQTTSRRGGLRRHVLEPLSGAANAMHGMVAVLLGHRPARP